MSGEPGPLVELPGYVAVAGRMDELVARFRERTLALFAAHGFRVGTFFRDGDDPDVLLYTVAWDDRAALDAGWAAFAVDPAWVRIREETEADGPLVERIERTFMLPAGIGPAR